MHGAEVTERKSARFGEASRPDFCSTFQAHHALVSNRLHLDNPFTFSSLEAWGMASSEVLVFGYSYNLYVFFYFHSSSIPKGKVLAGKEEATAKKEFLEAF